MYFSDALTLDAPKRTTDGYLAVRARAARTGVYQYTGREVDPNNAHGLRDQAIVNVLRDEKTVFDTAAAHSFIGKPVTDDHPSEAVNSANWRDHARGVVMGALRDGEYLAFDLLLTDAATISKVDAGKRDLSNGYGAEIEFGDFKSADGTACQARQSKITGGNHVAIVGMGRAGSKCGIPTVRDSFALCDANPGALSTHIFATDSGERIVKKLIIDGLQVDLSDASAVETAIGKIQGQLADANTKSASLETQVATLTTDSATKDATIVTLTQQLADAQLTPAQLRDTAKVYASVVDSAKKLGVTVGDNDSTDMIMKACVLANPKLADAAASWNDAQIAASFASLTANLGDAQPDPLRQTIISNPVNIGDAAAAYNDAQRKAREERANAWKTPATAAAA